MIYRIGYAAGGVDNGQGRLADVKGFVDVECPEGTTGEVACYNGELRAKHLYPTAYRIMIWCEGIVPQAEEVPAEPIATVQEEIAARRGPGRPRKNAVAQGA